MGDGIRCLKPPACLFFVLFTWGILGIGITLETSRSSKLGADKSWTGIPWLTIPRQKTGNKNSLVDGNTVSQEVRTYSPWLLTTDWDGDLRDRDNVGTNQPTSNEELDPHEASTKSTKDLCLACFSSGSFAWYPKPNLKKCLTLRWKATKFT